MDCRVANRTSANPCGAALDDRLKKQTPHSVFDREVKHSHHVKSQAPLINRCPLQFYSVNQWTSVTALLIWFAASSPRVRLQLSQKYRHKLLSRGSLRLDDCRINQTGRAAIRQFVKT